MSETPKDIQIGVRNFDKFRELPSAAYRGIRFDSNDDCNIHCVYCHNARSANIIDLDSFHSFVSEKVIEADLFQIGCAMEPTLDSRLTDFMLAVAASPAKPRRGLRLQTNGILLHRHDPEIMLKAGLRSIGISVDSANVDTHKGLRGGTSLAKVQNNITAFRKSCPTVEMEFLTTVTSENIDDVDDLVAWGIDAGANLFVLRQMFYFTHSKKVDHTRMPDLLVTAEQFAAMRERLTAKFGKATKFRFLTNSQIVEYSMITQINSLNRRAGSKPEQAQDV